MLAYSNGSCFQTYTILYSFFLQFCTHFLFSKYHNNLLRCIRMLFEAFSLFNDLKAVVLQIRIHITDILEFCPLKEILLSYLVVFNVGPFLVLSGCNSTSAVLS